MKKKYRDITDEELYELAYYHHIIDYRFTLYKNIDATTFLSQNAERLVFLSDLYNGKYNSDYKLYYEMIHLGVSKEEIFSMTLKERTTYLFLFESKQ